MPPRTALFAYGSLADPRSASLTLGREVSIAGLARLEGHRRRFSQARDNRRCEKTFARADDGTVPRWILGLNVERDAGAGAEAPNGTLIEVSEPELERLDRRELRYARVEVTAATAASGGEPFDRVFTYLAREANLVAEPPAGALILARYAATVEQAFGRLGTGQLAAYRRTTLPYPVEVVEGVLVADSIPEGNPREW